MSTNNSLQNCDIDHSHDDLLKTETSSPILSPNLNAPDLNIAIAPVNVFNNQDVTLHDSHNSHTNSNPWPFKSFSKINIGPIYHSPLHERRTFDIDDAHTGSPISPTTPNNVVAINTDTNKLSQSIESEDSTETKSTESDSISMESTDNISTDVPFTDIVSTDTVPIDNKSDRDSIICDIETIIDTQSIPESTKKTEKSHKDKKFGKIERDIKSIENPIIEKQQTYSGKLTVSDYEPKEGQNEHTGRIKGYRKLSRDIFMTRANKTISDKCTNDPTIDTKNSDNSVISTVINSSSICPEKIRRCVEEESKEELKDDFIEDPKEEPKEEITEKIYEEKEKNNVEQLSISFDVKTKSDSCPMCKISDKTKEIIEKVEKIMEIDNQEIINNELQTITSGPSNILDTVDIDSNTTSTCIVDKLISHISHGGEAAGVHLGLFRVNIIIKDDDGSEFKTITRYKTCAIKVIPNSHGKNEQNIIRAFKYSNIKYDSYIIKHIISYESDKYICLVNEYIDGHSLEAMIDHHFIDINNSVKATIVKQIYSGLRALHKEGYIHLDMKPGNVILYNGPEKDKSIIKIIDFGKTVSIDMNLVNTDQNIICDEKLKRKFLKNIFSTPVYVCPNIVLDEKYEHVSSVKDIYYFGILCDLWAFGMTMYDLYVGETYYDKENSLLYGKIFKQMARELKKNPQLNIRKLIKNKDTYGISDDLIEVMNLCLRHRSFKPEIVDDCLKILTRMDEILSP
jgi:hypothetical protein